MDSVECVMAKMEAGFGPGLSNGLVSLLAHDELPEVFGPSAWGKWMFKPAKGAFTLADEWGIIRRHHGGWTMTELGKQCAAHIQKEMAS